MYANGLYHTGCFQTCFVSCWKANMSIFSSSACKTLGPLGEVLVKAAHYPRTQHQARSQNTEITTTSREQTPRRPRACEKGGSR